MGMMALMGVEIPFVAGTAAADPQILFIDNFPYRDAFNTNGSISNATLSICQVNIPLHLSFNNVLIPLRKTATNSGTASVSFGLYSMNAGTLSLANSGSASTALTANESMNSWLSLATSAAQNITPGAWYFAVNIRTSNVAYLYYVNSTFAADNAMPFLINGRMTASTLAMPASIATSDLDITGPDAVRQPYASITA